MQLIRGIFFYAGSNFDSNKYLIQDETNLLIDPGNPHHLSLLVRGLREDGFRATDIDLIANTHLHYDHCGANRALRKLSRAQLALHPQQQRHLELSRAAHLRWKLTLPDFTADILLGSELNLGSTRLRILHTPGHSPGSISFYDEKRKMLICGDLIFRRSIGRTDLPGGNARQLNQSVRKLSQLDIEWLLPGHGALVRGDEVCENFTYVLRNILGETD
jgi:glyoxylase-like metal-dependent hydrolase (beta-lactamase superfamily II)